MQVQVRPSLLRSQCCSCYRSHMLVFNAILRRARVVLSFYAGDTWPCFSWNIRQPGGTDHSTAVLRWPQTGSSRPVAGVDDDDHDIRLDCGEHSNTSNEGIPVHRDSRSSNHQLCVGYFSVHSTAAGQRETWSAAAGAECVLWHTLIIVNWVVVLSSSCSSSICILYSIHI